jgi:NAD(P)-dependent dehydrogenase (short-subunit alcohol dehydrogenase family)
MANYYWPIVAATVTVLFISVAVPFLLAEVFPWRNLYKQRNAKLTVKAKSYKGKTVLISGANGAFGSRAAKLVAERDVETLILLDVKDCTEVKEQILAGITATKKPNILVWQVDMMSYASCQAFAKKARELKSLDHVLLTAGILSFNRRESPEGWETCECSFLSNPSLQVALYRAIAPLLLMTRELI